MWVWVVRLGPTLIAELKETRMPYLEYVFCERCGDYARLDIDPSATIEAYREEGRQNAAITQQTLVWDYLVYSCGICGNKYRYTFRDIEEKVRNYFSSLSQEYKEYFDEVIEKAEGREVDVLPPVVSATPKEQVEDRTAKVKNRVRDLYTAKN